MSLKKIYNDKFNLSFEVFPPKTDKGMENLFRELQILKNYAPSFISVTYGAGGSTQEKTLNLVERIQSEIKVEPLMHFTCVGASKNEIQDYMNVVKEKGLHNILALRGDPPRGVENFEPHPDGFAYANDLVAFIKSLNNFNIAVAGYPEGHPEAGSFDADIDNLKKKIDAGGEIIITQLFFDNDDFKRYIDKIRSKGIDVPVIPGILPVTGKNQIDKIVSLSGAKIPKKLIDALDKCNIADDICRAGIDYSIEQCEELLREDVAGFHFYPLNKSKAVSLVLDNITLP